MGRMRDRARRTSKARQARLQQRRYRLAAETAEERESRLQPRRERLAAKTVDEREARLQQMRDRLAAETAEGREARLCSIRALTCVEFFHLSLCSHAGIPSLYTTFTLDQTIM